MMNHKQFVEYFRTNVMPGIREQEAAQGGEIDNPLRAETWINLIDDLVTDRYLPRIAMNWSCPFDSRK